jgi:hypothetical protein
MNKLTVAEQKTLDNAEPQNQNLRLGARLMEEAMYGGLTLQIAQPAGAVGVSTPLPLPSDPDLLFDFEVIDATVRTESAVTSSAVQLRAGTNAVSDAVVSAANKAVTRVGTLDQAYTKFYPKSNPAGYAAAPLNLLDSGGATAAARTVSVFVKRI